MNKQEEHNTASPESTDSNGRYSGSSNIILIITVGVIAVIIASAFFWYTNKEGSGLLNNDSGDISESIWDPTGSIFLTLMPKGGTGMGIYEFNVSDNQLRPFYFADNKYVRTARFERGISSPMLVAERVPDGLFQIHSVENGVGTVITDTEIPLKRHPVWSAAYDSVIYSAKEDYVDTFGKANESGIYMVGRDGVEKKITHGTLPTLTPDGKSVVVLRNDGLHMVSLMGTSSERIWAMANGSTSLNMHFSVSPSGRYIAWTNPDQGKMYVMEVTSWAPFKGSLRYVVETHAFWPVISPDDKYIAFEEVEWTDPPTKPRLIIMNLNTLERRMVQDLDAFDQLYMFMNDWK